MQERSSGWTGLAGFAGVLLMVSAVFVIIQGFVALFTPGYYAVGANGLLVFTYNGWGITHLIAGALLAATGAGILAGATWARVTGVIVASLSAIAQIGFMAAFPVWSILVIALDVLIIYALAVHGGELAQAEMERREEEPTTDMRRRAG